MKSKWNVDNTKFWWFRLFSCYLHSFLYFVFPSFLSSYWIFYVSLFLCGMFETIEESESGFHLAFSLNFFSVTCHSYHLRNTQCSIWNVFIRIKDMWSFRSFVSISKNVTRTEEKKDSIDNKVQWKSFVYWYGQSPQTRRK